MGGGRLFAYFCAHLLSIFERYIREMGILQLFANVRINCAAAKPRFFDNKTPKHFLFHVALLDCITQVPKAHHAVFKEASLHGSLFKRILTLSTSKLFYKNQHYLSITLDLPCIALELFEILLDKSLFALHRKHGKFLSIRSI